MKLVSVIVPIYNSAPYLGKCIDSILQQTYRNFELILVDDGSTDLSSKICRQYQNIDKRIIYIHKKNEGVSSTRNEGIKVAKGEFIIFVDSDDFIKKEMLEKLLCESSFDFVMCGYELYDSKKDTTRTQYQTIKFKGSIRNFAEKIKNYLSPPFLLGPCFKMFRKAIIAQYNIQFPLDLDYGEDAIFVFEYLKHCKTVSVISNIEYSYRKHSNDTLSSKFLIDKIDINYIINKSIENFLKQQKVNNYNQILQDRFLDNLVSYTQELLYSQFNLREKRLIYNKKFEQYKSKLGKPKRISQKIVIYAGLYKFLYPIIYIFKMKGKK